jgi:DNA-directed RNA polymerase specialized sigma24 family protein
VKVSRITTSSQKIAELAQEIFKSIFTKIAKRKGKRKKR